jgi:putative cell wall-binding protein
MVRSMRSSISRTIGVVAAGLLVVVTALVAGPGLAGAVSPDISNFAISPPTPAVVVQGQSAVAVPNETFTLVNDFAAGNTITFTLSPNGATANCKTGTTDYVAFAATPTVSAAGAPPTDTLPQITVSVGPNTANDGACGGTLNDVLTLTFKNSASPSNTDTWTVTISGIAYNIGSTTTTGAVSLADATTLVNGTSSATAASNATVDAPAKASASGNSPQTDVTVNTASTVSSITVTESAAGAVTGSICITPITGETTFNFTGTPTTSASPTGTGAGTVTSTVVTGGSILVTVTASTSLATTYTISGISVADGAGSGPAAAVVTTGGANCSADSDAISTSVSVFNSAPVLKAAIAGPDIDATAIAELEAAYPIDGGAGCVPSHTVVLATDQNFPDALSASYLAGYLGTGLLLTPTAQLSNETQAALQDEGITDVYVVGGPLAVSQNTINEITSTPAFTCGGPGLGRATGGNISVTGPIFGQTQYDTSEQIAATPPSSYVASIDLAGAYANQYNDTTGNDSSAPEAAGALKTAIVASGANFPDASSASVMAYHNRFPLVLTDPTSLSTQAATTLSALGIQQVIVLGGPLAVSNADVSSIMGMGISVIRVAGQDATDTAIQLASFELNQQGTTFSGLGWGAPTTWNNTVLVARGDFYSDALAGSVLAAIHAAPLLLTENPTSLGTYLPGFLNTGGSAAGIDGLNAVVGSSGNIQTVQPLGGPLALNASTLSAFVADVAEG